MWYFRTGRLGDPRILPSFQKVSIVVFIPLTSRVRPAVGTQKSSPFRIRPYSKVKKKMHHCSTCSNSLEPGTATDFVHQCPSTIFLHLLETIGCSHSNSIEKSQRFHQPPATPPRGWGSPGNSALHRAMRPSCEAPVHEARGPFAEMGIQREFQIFAGDLVDKFRPFRKEDHWKLTGNLMGIHGDIWETY